jgi:hypothetical protein
VVEISEALGRGQQGATPYPVRDERSLFDGIAWPSALDFTAAERATPFFRQDVQCGYKGVTGAGPPKGTNYLGNPGVPFCGRANWPYGDGHRSTLDRWDTLALDEFLGSRGVSPDWRRLYAAENGTESFSTIALGRLMQSELDRDW